MRIPYSAAVCAVIATSFVAAPSWSAQDGTPDRVANVEAAQVAVPPAVDINPIGAAMRSLLADVPRKLLEPDKDDRAALAAYYSASDSTQMWVDKSGFNERARAVMSELDKAGDWGLTASEFAKPSLPAAALTDAELAEAEITLSLSVLKYARHARGGRISEPTKQLSSYIDRKPPLKEPAQVLAEISKASSVDGYLRDLHPKHAQFVKLREQLLELRTSSAAQKELIKVPAKGPIIQPGESHPDVALVRKRLEVAPVIGADGEASAEEFFDDEMLQAVVAFQAERGVKSAKGAINAATRSALNTEAAPPVTERKIIANMEGYRWLPEDLGDLHVWVNIPEFMVRVVKNGEVIHAERIITGKIDTQTPIFSDVMETVVIHPFWGVPESIKVKELYPGLARGGDTLTRAGLRLQYNGRDVSSQSVDWSTANIKNFHVYQPPGPGNVLGVVKFLFPNKHQVYMHDTPTKHLFATPMRTYSHGCMRVRNPLRLAEVLLKEDKGWEAAKIADLVKGGPQNNEIKLDRQIPVHVNYFTAWVDDTGKLASAKDFYGHESRISLALDGKWAQIARGKDHLAPVKAEPISRLAESSAKYKPANPLGDFFSALFGGAN